MYEGASVIIRLVSQICCRNAILGAKSITSLSSLATNMSRLKYLQMVGPEESSILSGHGRCQKLNVDFQNVVI